MIVHYLNTAFSVPCIDDYEMFELLTEHEITSQSKKTTCLACWWWIAFSPISAAASVKKRK